MKVLVIAAHPDDELLGAGATLARHADAGDEVIAYIGCLGANVRYDQTSVASLKAAARAAARILGTKDLRFGEFVDQSLETVRLLDVVKPLEALVAEFKPESVYTHFFGDLNRDHRVIAEAAAIACRPYAAPSVRNFYGFDTASTTEWASSAGLASFVPNRFVDITGTLERKLQAFAKYDSEVRAAPHPRSLEALRSRAAYWGSISGVNAAEAFVVLREVDTD